MTKGIYPKAVLKNIPPGSNDPPIRPRIAILHVDAGNAHSLFDYFRHRSGGVESHFHVRKDGVVEQYRNIYWQADANHKANDFAVSIETQGYGHGKWNEKQIKAIKYLLIWLHEEADIPYQKADRWDGEGVGYHVQFGAPGAWTPVAKSCPGPDRVKQFNRRIVKFLARKERERIKTVAKAAKPKRDRDRPLRVALRTAQKAASKVGRKSLAKRLKARRIALRPKRK